MKFHKATKIIFVILAVMIVAGVLLIIAEYPKLRKNGQSVSLNSQNTYVSPSPTTAVQAPATTITQSPTGDIIVTAPQPGQLVVTPVTFSGKAQASWFVKGNFQVRLLDADNTLLGFGTAVAQSGSEDGGYIIFSGQFNFSKATGQTGKLIFENASTSGSATNHEDFSVPVNFSTTNTSLQPSGTCAPDLANCKGDPELCMTENANQVCD